MKKSTLTPFIRKDLDILFVGLNPADGSSDKGHYFSVNQAFWNQLYDSGLITQQINKSIADDIVFGSTRINNKGWNYGITDLVTEIADSNSGNINPTVAQNERLKKLIIEIKPKVVVLMHSKVLKRFVKHLGYIPPESNSGNMGTLIDNCSTVFYNIAFPHGNAIKSEDKVRMYDKIKEFLKNN